METKEQRQVVVKIRLSETEVQKLKADGKAHGRGTAAAEAAYRLRGGSATGISPFANWPPEAVQDFEAFGAVAAGLLAEVTTAAGTKASLQHRLGHMRVVLTALLDDLGADMPDAEDADYFRKLTLVRLGDMARKPDAAAPGNQYFDTEEAKGFRHLQAKVESTFSRVVRKLGLPMDIAQFLEEAWPPHRDRNDAEVIEYALRETFAIPADAKKAAPDNVIAFDPVRFKKAVGG